MKHLNQLFNTGEIHYEPTETPTSVEDIAAALEKSGEAAVERVKTVSDDLGTPPPSST